MTTRDYHEYIQSFFMLATISYCTAAKYTNKYGRNINKKINPYEKKDPKAPAVVTTLINLLPVTVENQTKKNKEKEWEPYECGICFKTFPYPSQLKRHKITHMGEKPYHCDTCDKKFTNSGSLIRHKRIHTGEKPYHCDTCDKKFTYSGSLKIHGRTHTGEKPYECDICPKRFARDSQLKSHRRTHTGEKPYECSYCHKCFFDSSTLKRHQKQSCKLISVVSERL